MESFATLFHEDATFVNRFGRYVRGVEAIVEMHAPIHATIYSDSTLENELIHVVTIGPEAVVMPDMVKIAGGLGIGPRID
ncbi:SgcJ/EcaC family oxidoreductase [Cupriavidus sp. H18C1]|uniref:SgcJ/EcaC family oxidoreductase n=1 Tax=Cupriavidus sp. H18C1 TaxID=3241601 RepID=UPI003BB8B3D4